MTRQSLALPVGASHGLGSHATLTCMAAKAKLATALDVLIDPTAIEPRPICVLIGDEGYLQHETRRALLTRILGAGEESAAEVLDGRSAELRDVLDALHERSLFGGTAIAVVVEMADNFVKNYRAQLEDYVAKPATDAVLILEVSTFPGATRLAKAAAESGLVLKCQAPDQGRELGDFNRQLQQWLAAVAKREFQCELPKASAELLLELLPSEAGILYQEVLKLALMAGEKQPIDAALVRDQVGGWRTRKTWDMIDAAADGRAPEALAQLDRLLAAGEEPHALLPQMASTLRKFAMAVRLYEQAQRRKQTASLRWALEQAGVPAFKLNDAEQQLRQIGRPRAQKLYRWLLAADLELKGHNSTKERARRVIETLIVRLARPAAAK